ncbi:carboxylating nicotinate-nucleotide diphosphorylase [Halalkalibacillus halophilus]|uniref:carboxylating nicotinate-nucleotide diphosphorylase n=1 Tax=Halalkalibacillus halophilus TaxID=392827 RepID=UPI0004184AFA|nr:carboxylating nicotinate-nucleotide diphosphorylase [Halalkalibacillus halophilus]
MNKLKLKEQLSYFLNEDLGYGDLTSDAIFTNQFGALHIVSKSSGYFSGEEILSPLFQLLDKKSMVTMKVTDGEKIEAGQTLALVNGEITKLLQGERVAINLLQRLSAITTKTVEAITKLDDSTITIADTRKTTPGLRMLEKYAVKIGGGKNHRFRLDDCVMIKDNHIAACGSIKKAVEMVQLEVGHTVKIEVEIENVEQIEEAIQAGVDIIMLDNVPIQEIEFFVSKIPNHIITEISGGITLDNLYKYKNCGVNVISLGLLTHQITSLDFSAYIMKGEEK